MGSAKVGDFWRIRFSVNVRCSDCQVLVPQLVVVGDFTGRSVEDDLTHVEDEHAARQVQRGDGALLDDDGREAERLDLIENLLDLLIDHRCQPFVRLVQQQLHLMRQARVTASICCSPLDKVTPSCLRRSARRGKCS